MDTTKAIYKPPIHKHPLYLSPSFFSCTCRACHVRELNYGYYFCNECSFWFHKECAEAELEINHPSHPEHPLSLVDNIPEVAPCGLCGGAIVSPYYVCHTCGFKVDLTCGIKQYPHVIDHPKCHDHPLVFLEKLEEPCEVCKESIGRPSYSCLECHVYFHVDCVHLSKEVNHPFHSSHPLIMVNAFESVPQKRCHFCLIQPEKVCYHCHLCNFTMCLGCIKKPLPLVVEHTKTHRHPLRLLTRQIKFTCEFCGVEGDSTKTYICIECGDFVIHGDCIDLPRVININRHNHRITFRKRLDHGDTNCGVCRGNVSQYYGAYSCSICPNYAVHSMCAIKPNVWDLKELEEIPEIIEDIAPFKEEGDNLIRHFSHQNHTLRLHKDMDDLFRIVDKWTQYCEACIGQVGFEPIYSCEECRFVLHEKCANLEKKKKLLTQITPFTLQECLYELCNLCRTLSGGFMYSTYYARTSSHSYVDVRCGSISEPFIHDGHSHPLYFDEAKDHSCDACHRHVDDGWYMLRCDPCGFDLCFRCAILPKMIWHRSDDEHPLALCCGRKFSDKDLCDVCEMELDPTIWFFTCSACEVNLHVGCALGDFSHHKPETLFTIGGKEYKVVLNYRNTRPWCSQCQSRCTASVILKHINGEDNGYICSGPCLSRSSGL